MCASATLLNSPNAQIRCFATSSGRTSLYSIFSTLADISVALFPFFIAAVQAVVSNVVIVSLTASPFAYRPGTPDRKI